MDPDLNFDARDIDLELLSPLHPREINLKTNAGFRKILASIMAIGLIEPLAVCAKKKNGPYVILDGYLRYMACLQLKVSTAPCFVYRDMQAYTFNKNVNRLSPLQESRMLQKSMETIDERTIAQTFGIRSIRYRLAPKLAENLHPTVVKALHDELISKLCAIEFLYVVLDRQAEILEEMKKLGDFGRAFCRSLVLKTPSENRTAKKLQPTRWIHNGAKKKDLIFRLEHAEKQHEFYSTLYRQYSTDLLRLTFFVRKVITNASAADYL